MRVSEILKKCLRNKNFILGSCMVGLMVLIMVVGFFYMPYDPDVMDTAQQIAVLFRGPSPWARTSLAGTSSAALWRAPGCPFWWAP